MVADVLYPGLAHHPQHALAARQMQGGFGGMLSVRVRAGEQAAVSTAARVELWKRATSLGGVESLIEHRASIEGAGSPCPTDLLRLSVGLEAVDGAQGRERLSMAPGSGNRFSDLGHAQARIGNEIWRKPVSFLTSVRGATPSRRAGRRAAP
jgi:hypothetical protein